MSLSLSNSLSFALILLVKIEEEEIQKMITIMIEVSVAMMMRTTEMMIMAHRGEEGWLAEGMVFGYPPSSQLFSLRVSS